MVQDLIEESRAITNWCRVSLPPSEIDTNFCQYVQNFKLGITFYALLPHHSSNLCSEIENFIRVYRHTEEYKIDMIIKKREKEKDEKPLRGDIDVTGGVQEEKGRPGWG